MSNNNSNCNNAPDTSSSPSSQGSSYTESSFEEEDGECFFADRTLDLEDAHALATPLSVSRKTSRDAFDLIQNNNANNTTNDDYDNGLRLLQNARLVGDDGVMSMSMRSISSNMTSPVRTSSRISSSHNNIPSNVNMRVSSRSSSSAILVDVANDVNDRQQMTHAQQPHDLASLQEALEERVNAKFGNGNNNSNNERQRCSNSATMNRIVSMEVVSSGSTMGSNTRRPTMPRDTAWGVTAVLFLPLSLLLPFYVAKHDNNHDDDGIVMESSAWEEAARSSQAQHITFWGGLISCAVAIVLCRLTYKTLGGPAGEESRKSAASKIAISNLLSLIVQPLLVMLILNKAPSAWPFIFLPLILLARELNVFRNKTHDSVTGLRDGKITFFKALASMALDILSRSLKRSSIYRLILGSLLVQFFLVILWRSSLFAAIESPGMMGAILTPMSLIGGWWATGVVARILALIVSAGINSWLSKQSVIVEQIAANAESAGDMDEHPSFESFRAPRNSSAYRPINLLDEFDEEEEDEENDFILPVQLRDTDGSRPNDSPNSLRPVLFSAMTISFGSVAQCGFVGGIAQLMRSFIRRCEEFCQATESRRSGGEFRGMRIGDNDSQRSPNVFPFYSKLHFYADAFVRSHSDLGLSHVAAYFKTYRRASADVSDIIYSSGLEPIIYDDITSDLCGSCCIGVSALIVAFLGVVLSSNRGSLSDSAYCNILLFTFVMSYTMIFTVLEPLRASIKAVYVCFAQYPQSLSISFPLIFHRLTRITEDANIA
eukprot:CAMPEP_0116045330 /NCGR_PEP_ID=MMETSP0321-20121206/27554_1 /TAXON_ID=163516 /ORGANISM="Leptocylindrus danicus var. danicus, Strain B650" /LENGTH=772 /DNA_ID=CAMNT_0003526643 /DNA_START=8 /DNA_END=2326 /DNA_ORIENTATION=+